MNSENNQEENTNEYSTEYKDDKKRNCYLIKIFNNIYPKIVKYFKEKKIFYIPSFLFWLLIIVVLFGFILFLLSFIYLIITSSAEYDSTAFISMMSFGILIMVASFSYGVTFWHKEKINKRELTLSFLHIQKRDIQKYLDYLNNLKNVYEKPEDKYDNLKNVIDCSYEISGEITKKLEQVMLNEDLKISDNEILKFRINNEDTFKEHLKSNNQLKIIFFNYLLDYNRQLNTFVSEYATINESDYDNNYYINFEESNIDTIRNKKIIFNYHDKKPLKRNLIFNNFSFDQCEFISEETSYFKNIMLVLNFTNDTFYEITNSTFKNLTLKIKNAKLLDNNKIFFFSNCEFDNVNFPTNGKLNNEFYKNFSKENFKDKIFIIHLDFKYNNNFVNIQNNNRDNIQKNKATKEVEIKKLKEKLNFYKKQSDDEMIDKLKRLEYFDNINERIIVLFENSNSQDSSWDSYRNNEKIINEIKKNIDEFNKWLIF